MPPVDNRSDFEPWWPVCVADGCRGAQHADTRKCHVHGRDYAGLAPGSDLDLRGVEINSAQLAEVLGKFRDHERKRFVFGRVLCQYTWFTGRAWFDNAEVRNSARFDNACFGQLALFVGTEVAENLSFTETRFDGETWMGPLSAAVLNLARARVANPLEITVTATHVNWADARFEGGVALTTASVVEAAGVHFGAPSTITGAKVTSLAGSDVSNLVLTGVDLGECRFLGAHRLEQLRVDGDTRFARHRGRRVLAEEGSEAPARVAALYRALRKSFEDSKNEAGAGDFYYGEMECRRHSEESSFAEQMILWCYWLLSGYGQRASRALAWLVVVVSVVTGLLTVWGQDFGMAARIAVGAVVFRDDRTELTSAGEWTVLVARFLGPVLLALAVLAVRARVKR